MEFILVIGIAAVAVAAVLYPTLRTGRNTPRPAIHFADDDALDAAVALYRAALRAGTVCARCRFANPDGSRYCADCGRRIARPEDEPGVS